MRDLIIAADRDLRARIAFSKDLLVPLYLVASYAGHIAHEPICSDDMMDELARQLDESWDDIGHPHRDLIPRQALKGDTLFGTSAADYPPITAGSFHAFRAEIGFPMKPEGIVAARLEMHDDQPCLA